MASIATLSVDVEARTSKFSKGIKAATAVLAVLGAGAFKAVKAASSLEEAVSATETTFGKSSDQVKKWSKNTQDAFSQTDFLTAAKSFAVFGKAAKLSDAETAKFSKGLIDAAQDMASFHDANPAEVLADIQSGLAGQSEPLRKYGILMTEAAVAQEAAKMGIAKLGKPLTEQQKVLARRSLIMGQLGDATGDWERTITSAANQERIQAANTADLTAQLGNALLPAYKTLLSVGLQIVSYLGQHQGLVKVLTATLAGLAAVVLVTAAAWKIYVAGQRIATIVTKITNASLRVQRILLMTSIIGALILLGVAIVVAWKKFETFRNIVTGVLNKVRDIARAVFNFIRDHWKAVVTKLPAVFIITKIIQHFNTIRDVGKAVFNAVRDAARRVEDAIRGVITAISDAIAWLDRLANKITSLPRPPTGIKGAARALIPGLQHGGIVRRPTIAMVGEAGPEAVIPLSKLGSVGRVRGAGGEVRVIVVGGDSQAISWFRNAVATWERNNGKKAFGG